MAISIYDTPTVVNLIVPESAGTGTFVLNNYPINRTDFNIIQGVQNEPLFFVRDIDRKFVDLTGQTLTINIVDTDADQLLMSRNLVLVDATKSLYRMVILPAETVDWQIGALRWSISNTRSDGSTIMLYTDLNYGPYGYCRVMQGPMPGPQQAQILDPTTFLIDLGSSYSSALRGAVSYGYPNGMQTFAITMAGFTGKITIQASLISQPAQQTDWFDVTVQMLPAITDGIVAMNAAGNFLWLRLAVITVTGSLTQVLYKN